ncbi:MAG: hypothetical protein IH840_06745 [Candidatus Heimdallarchaeota archaeon]|nr:hypothetical protein [Candidatus Heimdallarchaeota archaeon]
MNFGGLSLVTLQHFPKQYFSSFLVADYSATRDLRTKYLNKLVSGSEIKITSVTGTDISFKLHSEVISYPFQLDKNHVLFPSTEIVMQLEPNSLNGRIVIDKSIGEFIESGELLDPFGKVINNIELYLNDGEIDRIISSDRIGDRLESVLNSLQSGEKKFSKFGIGIGPPMAHTGFTEVDKLLDGLCSFGTSINSLELICSFNALDVL